MSILIVGPSGRIDRIVDENVLEPDVIEAIKRELPQPIAEEIEEFNRPAQPVAMATSIVPGMYSVASTLFATSIVPGTYSAASTIFGNAKTRETYSIFSGKRL